MEDIKCVVCHETFTPAKSRKYEVRVNSGFMGNRIFEAFDCPYCGCQHVVNERYPRVDEKGRD